MNDITTLLRVIFVFFITVFQTRYVKEAKIDLKIGKDLFDWMFNEELEDQLEDLMKDFRILEVKVDRGCSIEVVQSYRVFGGYPRRPRCSCPSTLATSWSRSMFRGWGCEAEKLEVDVQDIYIFFSKDDFVYLFTIVDQEKTSI